MAGPSSVVDFAGADLVPGVDVPGVDVPGVEVLGVDVPGVDVLGVDVDVAPVVVTGAAPATPAMPSVSTVPTRPPTANFPILFISALPSGSWNTERPKTLHP